MSKLPSMPPFPPGLSLSGMVSFIEHMLARSNDEIETFFEIGLQGASREDGLPPTGRNLRAFLEATRDDLKAEMN